MLTDKKLIRLRNHDWHSTIRDGTRAAEQNAKQGVTIDHTHIVWELLREAAFVSRAAYAVRTIIEIIEFKKIVSLLKFYKSIRTCLHIIVRSSPQEKP